MSVIKGSLKYAKNNNIIIGAANPTEFISSGNYALNELITGDFKKGFPNRHSFLLWGFQGSGKTFFMMQACKNAMDLGYEVIYLDTEFATHDDYLKRIGIDPNDPRFLVLHMPTIEETIKFTSELFSTISKNPDNNKVMLVLDSMSNLKSEKLLNEFANGELKADHGQSAKKKKELVSLILSQAGRYNMVFGFTGHAYTNLDPYAGQHKVLLNGGHGVEFLPSLAIYCKKKTIDGGVELTLKTTKNRFGGGEGRILKLEIPFLEGLSTLDGSLEMAENQKLIVRPKGSGWYTWENPNDVGNPLKFTKKDWTDEFAHKVLSCATVPPVLLKDKTENVEPVTVEDIEETDPDL